MNSKNKNRKNNFWAFRVAGFLVFVLFLFLFAVTNCFAAFPTDWGKSQQLAIDHTKLTANVSDFPILITKVCLPEEMFNADGDYPALNGGGDIRFSSDEAGTTQLPCEIVSFVIDNDPANGSAEIWVKVPSISFEADTSIYIWWDKADETQPVADDTYGSENVWKTGYKLVQHLKEDPSGGAPQFYDSTANDHHGTNNGGLVAGDLVAAKIGNGIDFDGASTDDYDVTDHTDFDFGNGDFTISFWAKSVTHGFPKGIIEREATATFQPWVVCDNSTTRIDFYASSNGSSYDIANGVSMGTFNTDWAYYAISRNGTSIKLYRNGTQTGSTITSSATLHTGSGNVRVGEYYASSYQGIFDLDELEILKGDYKSVDWLTAEYNNQNDPGSFIAEYTPPVILNIDETTASMDDRRVIAYDENEQGAILLTGLYSETTPTHIEVQVFNRTTDAVVQVGGNDWNTITDEVIAAGAWSGSLSGIPKTNAWLGFTVRKSNETGTTYTSTNKIGVGYIVAYTGQSYMGYWIGYGPFTPTEELTSNDLCSKFRHLTTGQSWVPPAYTGWELNTGTGSIPFANKLQSELDCPIGVLDYGMGGSALLQANATGLGYWLGTDTSTNWYYDLVDGIAVSDPIDRIKANALIWYQGYTDCNVDVSYQDYYDGMTDLFALFRTTLDFANLPIFVVGQPRNTTTAVNSQSYTDVRVAQIDIADDNNETITIVAGQAVDQPLYADGVHLAEAGEISEAARYAQSVLWYEIGTGDYAWHRGPRAVGWKPIDATHTDIYIQHDGGTDFTPISGIDSFGVYNSDTTSWITATGERQNATTVRLTHASATITDIRILWGEHPVITNILRDNSTLTLPIEALQDFPYIPNQNYTRGDYVSLPLDTTDLENVYSEQDYTDVAIDDSTRVAQTATSEYAIHEFKDFVGESTNRSLTWNGQTNLTLSSSTVYLQIYNHNTTTWDEVDSDNSSSVDTDFTLEGNIVDLTNYKDTNNLINCRVYQNGTLTLQTDYWNTEAINSHTLTYSANANGTISGTTPQTISHGGNGTEVTAVPDANYHFTTWSDSVLTASRTDTNVTEDISVSASFAIDTHTVTFQDYDTTEL
ncbi:MAG: hypothetical protein UR78_C0005G0045, partial [Candidatus Moranbacteria bacterium GW2011_GWF2_35_39]